MSPAEYQELVEFLGKRFDRIDQQFEQVDQRFEQVDQRFDAVENRLARVEVKGEETRHHLQILAEGITAVRDLATRGH